MAGSKGAVGVVKTGNPEHYVGYDDLRKAQMDAAELFAGLTEEPQITRTLDARANEHSEDRKIPGEKIEMPEFIPGGPPKGR